MSSTEKIMINLIPGAAPGGIMPRLRVSQNDSVDRIVQFEIYDGNAVADLSDVDEVYFGGTKPDGNGFTVSCAVSGNIVTAAMTAQSTVLSGEILCKLYLIYSTGSIRSTTFALEVDPDPLNGAGSSETEIQDIVAAASHYAEQAEESAQEAAQAATGAATAGAAAGQAAAEAVVNNKLDKSTAAEAWAPEEEYEAGQYRLYTNGHLYKCILNHTSSSSITPEDTTYWQDTTIADEISSCNSNYTNKVTSDVVHTATGSSSYLTSYDIRYTKINHICTFVIRFTPNTNISSSIGKIHNTGLPNPVTSDFLCVYPCIKVEEEWMLSSVQNRFGSIKNVGETSAEFRACGSFDNGVSYSFAGSYITT